MATDTRYDRLRRAVLAYDRAIKAYGVLGTAWVEHSDDLDRLYKAMLDAADIDYPGRDQADTLDES